MRKKFCLDSFSQKAFLAAFLVLFFYTSAEAADATLAWDPNSEADLAGYGIYYKIDDPGADFLLFGYITLSELDDSGNPAFTLTDLDMGVRYQFAVTAYDSNGNESYFSNSICAEIGTVNVPVSCAAAGGGGGGSSGGGGGGGGCFIRSALGEKDDAAAGLVGILLIFIFVSLRSLKSKTR